MLRLGPSQTGVTQGPAVLAGDSVGRLCSAGRRRPMGAGPRGAPAMAGVEPNGGRAPAARRWLLGARAAGAPVQVSNRRAGETGYGAGGAMGEGRHPHTLSGRAFKPKGRRAGVARGQEWRGDWKPGSALPRAQSDSRSLWVPDVSVKCCSGKRRVSLGPAPRRRAPQHAHAAPRRPGPLGIPRAARGGAARRGVGARPTRAGRRGQDKAVRGRDQKKSVPLKMSSLLLPPSMSSNASSSGFFCRQLLDGGVNVGLPL
jgi:hypothetical protein